MKEEDLVNSPRKGKIKRSAHNLSENGSRKESGKIKSQATGATL